MIHHDPRAQARRELNAMRRLARAPKRRGLHPADLLVILACALVAGAFVMVV